MNAAVLFSLALVIFSQALIANCRFSSSDRGVKRSVRSFPKLVMLPFLVSNDLDFGLSDDDEEEVEKILPFKCDCAKGPCMCCGDLDVSRIKLNRQTCIGLEYFGEEASVKVTISSNKDLVFDNVFAADDIPPICVTYPGMTMVADVCFKLHDNQLTRKKFHTCMRVTPRVLMQPITDVEVGCVTVGSSNGADDAASTLPPPPTTEEEKPTVEEEPLKED